MELRITFEPGEEQAMQAGTYFAQVATDLVDELIAGMQPYQYRTEPASGKPTAVRIWAPSQPSDEEALHVMAIAQALHADLDGLMADRDAGERIPRAIAEWLSVTCELMNFFVEHLEPDHAFTKAEKVLSSVALLGGRLRMVSSPEFMLIEQAHGLFGLAVGDVGSFLFEEIPSEQHVIVR